MNILAALLNDEAGMYKDWMIEDTQVVDGKIELTIYNEYTDAEFVSDDIDLLTSIVEMLAGERVELKGYTVEGKTVRALPL